MTTIETQLVRGGVCVEIVTVARLVVEAVISLGAGPASDGKPIPCA